jgi:hypothetical protein
MINLKPTPSVNLFLFFCSHLIETQFNLKIECLRSKNGVEFNMVDFYSSTGIINQISCIKTPQQNAMC